MVTQPIDHYVYLSSVDSIHDRHVQRKDNNTEKWERWALSEHDLDLWPWHPGRNLETSLLNVLENIISLRPVTAIFWWVGDEICPKCIEYIGIFRILQLSRTDVDSDFCSLCRHLLDFSNGTWPTSDQLHRKYKDPLELIWPPGFWVLGPYPSVYFLLVETVHDYSVHSIPLLEWPKKYPLSDHSTCSNLCANFILL